MDDSSDKSVGDGVDKKAETQASASNLPVVWSPKLDAAAAEDESAAAAGTDEAAASSDEAAETAKAKADETGAATTPRSWRFMQLAATIALAAALGSFVGSLAGSGISDRLDRVERAAAAPSAQLAHIADTVDRLDKINTAPETTGSIAAPATPSEAKIADRIVQDWLVQDVHGDRALVESRSGGLFEVGAGSVLPGLGKVESVKRLDGQWVVVTARGTITSGR